MFQQQENVTDEAVFTELDELLLQPQASSIVEGAELEHGNQDPAAPFQ
jgi:hypothetical protein